MYMIPLLAAQASCCSLFGSQASHGLIAGVLCCAVLCCALQKPKTLDEAVDKLVSLKLEDVRQGLTAEYAAKATALAARLEHLEQRLQQQAAQAVTQPPASASSHGSKGAAVSSRVASSGSRVASAKPAA